ncbi:hypothetical protein F5B18DRAFT_278483 [Nemania serpens]|nr:hypothetical protein F5B18DRAFT_278483 [Nemania serpens]
MLSKILLTTAVIGLATAQVPAIAKRDFLENRQTNGLDPECASAISDVSSLYSSVPTPPADLLSVTLPSDPCVTPTFTGTLQSEWATYTSEALQWYTSHSDELLSFITACSGLVDGSVATAVPICSSELSGVSSPATTTPASHTTKSGESGSTPAPTGASSSAGSSAVPTPNAAPRETSFVVAAAVAAAGFMGAVAAL